MGSPPQVRGKLPSWFWVFLPFRITPAGAGKTFSFMKGKSIAKDHPRRCGENPNSRIVRVQQSGSPPQVRGKLLIPLSLGDTLRITPAGAGKTGFRMRFNYGFEDHPRRCGENQHVRMHDRQGQGSPPQVRGKLCCFTSPTKGSGITPAGAGKTV